MSLVDFVRGRIVERDAESAVIAVGGLGMRILAPGSTITRLPEPGTEAMLYTYLVVREDALVLYGFATREERELFTQLLSVGGVGPKLALDALSSGPPDRLAATIAAGDVEALARIRGIGKKTAQRIVLELKGKLEMPVSAGAAGSGAPAGVFDVAAEALRAFGYTPAEVASALAAVPKDEELSEEEVVRRAFQAMGLRR